MRYKVHQVSLIGDVLEAPETTQIISVVPRWNTVLGQYTYDVIYLAPEPLVDGAR